MSPTERLRADFGTCHAAQAYCPRTGSHDSTELIKD